MSLASRIKKQRLRCGLSQEKLAEKAGVSRQAVAKWESGQSAPSTEKLFRLAEIFGTTVDMLLPVPRTEKPNIKEKLRGRLRLAALVIAAYAAVYLLGRVFCSTGKESSVMGWIFGTDPQQLSYLYGWLLKQKLFWAAMAISAAAAALGKKYFAFITLAGFALGLVSGELFGPYPAGEATGNSHYGWLIWGAVFALSIAAGAVVEKIKSNKSAPKGAER